MKKDLKRTELLRGKWIDERRWEFVHRMNMPLANHNTKEGSVGFNLSEAGLK